MSKLVALTAGLVWTASCAVQAPPSPAHESAAARKSLTTAPQAGDTAFVELRREFLANRHTADGKGCHFEGGVSPLPAGLPPGAVYSERTVSGDPVTCATVVAIGYRLQMPPLDTAGSASHTLSRDLNFADSANPARRKKP